MREERSSEEKIPFLTYLFIGLNVSAFFLIFSYLNPNRVFEAFSFSRNYFLNGNYLTILTSTFLHLDLSHLFWNMFFLFIFGRVVEKELGRSYFLLIYLLSAVLGNLFFASLFPGAVAAGASGAVFGLMGASMLIEPFRPIAKFIPIPLALIGAVYLYAETANAFSLEQGVAHIAHVGGMLGGFFIAFIKEKEKSKKGIVAVGLFLLLALTIGLL